ncbi:MAG: hypothetical protein LBU22_11805 [Dysgonamonadaceae bacterium]|jgi:hypothetical protein|nr:hypothetical protein [Dysgonamonadaceae bacterium]
MKEDAFLKKFIPEIQDIIPQRGKLAETLAAILEIEKEAVYRRLRGAVPFSFQEITKISLQLGLSLDSIVGSTSSLSKVVNTINFTNLKAEEYKMLDNYIAALRYTETDPDSEIGAVGNTIPASLYVSYEQIYKFQILQWTCQFDDYQKFPTYDEIIIPERLIDVNRFFVESVQNSPKTIYILDKYIFQQFVENIRYFYDIKLLSEKEVKLLKENLHVFLNDLERYADQGAFDTGKKVEIYLANIHFDVNYNYIDSKTYKITTLRAFSMSEAFSFDEALFANMKRWVYFLKRTSTMISMSDVMERIHYFDDQRKIVDTL